MSLSNCARGNFFRNKFKVKEMITSILTQRYNRLFFVWELVFAFEKKNTRDIPIIS